MTLTLFILICSVCRKKRRCNPVLQRRNTPLPIVYFSPPIPTPPPPATAAQGKTALRLISTRALWHQKSLSVLFQQTHVVLKEHTLCAVSLWIKAELLHSFIRTVFLFQCFIILLKSLLFCECTGMTGIWFSH